MGFLGVQSSAPVERKKHNIEMLHRLECRVCPLNKLKNRNPHIPAQGAKRPKVYILGEAPGKDEDNNNTIFTGESGELLRAHIPEKWEDQIRWNNVVRTRPWDSSGNRTPTEIEIECCRPSVEKDIAASKPKAIFGFGNIPLHWVSTRTRISMWRGRKFPVNVGGHECWYYAFEHPAFLYRKKSEKGYGSSSHIASEEERAFAFDMKRAFAEIDDLPDAVVHDKDVAMYGVEIIEGRPGDLARLEKLMEWAKKQKYKGFDWEANRLRPYAEGAKLLTAAIGTAELSFAWAIDHPQARWTDRERERVWELTRDFLENDEGVKAVHQLGYEQEWTAWFFDKRILRRTLWDDTITQAHIIDERLDNKRGKHQGPLSLDWLCFQYFGLNLKSLSYLDRNNLESERLDVVLRYNAMDAKYHHLLSRAQLKVIKREGLMEQYVDRLRRVPTCVLTQIKGLPTNLAVTAELKAKYEKQNESLLREISNLPIVADYKKRFKSAFDPTKNKQVEKMLRDVMGHKGNLEQDESYSVDEKSLKQIDHPFIPLLISLRKVNKRLSTYIYDDLWPDGLLHAIFNTVFTETWRLSAEDPNLQNIPKRVEENKEVRKQIAAALGKSIFSADYGQIEARVIAMFTRDKRFVQMLWERYDVHGDEARRLALAYPRRIGGKKFIDDKDVMKKLRDAVKNKWTFPNFFGATLDRVSEEMEIPENYLEPEYRRFQKTFEGVFNWHEELIASYREKGYVESMLGVRRHAPLSRNQVINTPIQNTAGEIVMDGYNRLSELADELQDDNLQPNIQIHDDLTFILDDDKIDKYAEPIIKEMIKIDHFKPFINVPITIEASIGRDLFSTKEFVAVSSDGRWEWKD